jgi:hypothetical protein
MKNPTGYLSNRTRTFCLAIAALFSFAMVLPSQAQIITLTDPLFPGVAAQINAGSQAGMFNWTVGGINQLTQHGFWYRIGTAGPEQSISTISAPTITQTTPNQATALYNNGAYSVQVLYRLTGNTASSGINESIRIINNTTNSADFHFFQYSDFDLNGTSGGQSVQFSPPQVTQTLGSVWSASQIVTATPNHSEAAFFNATLNSLNDGVATTLNDNLGPVGPGDVTFALQWDFTLAAGGSKLISPILTVQVPEPSALVLLALGLAAFTLRRAGAKDQSAPVARSR